MNVRGRCGFQWVPIALLLSGVVSLAAPAGDEFDKPKAIYHQHLQEIKQELETAQADLLGGYRKGLDAARKTARQKGDFDAVQALDSEIARFEAKKSLPTPSAVASVPDLARFVATSRDCQAKTELDRARKITQLTDQYLQFLEQHVKLAVRDDRLELAKQYKTEGDAVRESPDYLASKFLLAEKNDVKSGSEADSAVVSSNFPLAAITYTGPDGQKVKARLDPKGLYDAARIYEAPPLAETPSSTPLKPLSASDTGKASLSGGVGIALDGCLNAEAAKYQLRIKLRSKTTDGTLQNLKVLVQYFARQTSSGSVIESPNPQFASVPAVGSKPIACEMKPADLPFAVGHRYVGLDSISYREGFFVGVIVSVFSADDKLLAQVTSNTLGLKDRAKTTFGMPAPWVDAEAAPAWPPAPDPPIRVRRPR